MADQLDTTFQSVYDEQHGIAGTQITSQQQAGGMIDNYVMAYTQDEQHIASDQATINSAASTRAQVASAKRDMAGAEVAAAAAQQDASRVQTALDNLLANQAANVPAPTNPSAPTSGTSTIPTTPVGVPPTPPASPAAGVPAPTNPSAPTSGTSTIPTTPVGTPATPTTVTPDQGGVGHHDLGVTGAAPAAQTPVGPNPGGLASPQNNPPAISNTPGSATYDGGPGHQDLGVSGAAVTQAGVKQVPIHPGDTMIGIAQKYGVSLSQLEAANKDITHPDMIFAGRMINIPVGGPAPLPTSGDGGAASSPSMLQKVKDVLYRKKGSDGGGNYGAPGTGSPENGVLGGHDKLTKHDKKPGDSHTTPWA